MRELTLKDLLIGELGQQIKKAQERIELEKNFIKNITVMKHVMSKTTNGKIRDRLKQDDPEKLQEYLDLCDKVNKRREEREKKEDEKIKKMVEEGKIITIENKKINSKLRKRLKRLGIGEENVKYQTKKKNEKRPVVNPISADDKEITQSPKSSSDAS